MPRNRVISDEQLDALLEHYRANPPHRRADHVAAGKVAGVNWRTAKRAWERGWANTEPLRDRVADEQTRARAVLRREDIEAERQLAATERARDLELAVEDGAAQTARELAIVRGVQGQALDLLNQLAKLQPAIGQLVARITATAPTDPDEALRRLERLVRLTREAGQLAQAAIEMERARVGDPASVVNLNVANFELPSVADAEQQLAAAARAVSRLRAREQMHDIEIDDEQQAH